MSGVAAGEAGAAAGVAQAAAGAGAQFFLQHEPPSQAEATGVDEIANEPARIAELMNLNMIWFPFECRPGFPVRRRIRLTAICTSQVRLCLTDKTFSRQPQIDET
jgi:hypothetical protein